MDLRDARLRVDVFLSRGQPEFDLVSLIEGRRLGDIMRDTDTTIQLRGRGSGFREQQEGNGPLVEAAVPLMLRVSSVARDADAFFRALDSLSDLLRDNLPQSWAFFIGDASPITWISSLRLPPARRQGPMWNPPSEFETRPLRRQL